MPQKHWLQFPDSLSLLRRSGHGKERQVRHQQICWNPDDAGKMPQFMGDRKPLSIRMMVFVDSQRHYITFDHQETRNEIFHLWVTDPNVLRLGDRWWVLGSIGWCSSDRHIRALEVNIRLRDCLGLRRLKCDRSAKFFELSIFFGNYHDRAILSMGKSGSISTIIMRRMPCF